MLRKGTWIKLVLASVVAAGALAQQRPDVQSVTIDASHTLGRIRALNDLGGGPLCQRGIVDLTSYYKELGVHWVRLHDVPWTYDNSFDINYVFPKWEADPDRSENYEFAQTDYYLNSITSLGINIIYRLGYSAEYKTSVHHNAPPSSYDKFAEISKHIIRHHNEGWANGQKAGIRYWEIWNEPDGKGFWSGTPEEYYRFYVSVARALKADFPSLKVGGPALAHDLGFLEGLLKYCQQQKAPLDFVSWHIYTRDAHAVAQRAQQVHELMVKYGYANSESILDEWNYGPISWGDLFVDPVATRAYFDASQNAFGAAFDATVLTDLQNVPLDVATYYTGNTLMWGMFTSSGAPQKPYYAFLAFRRMLDCPKRVAIEFAHDDTVTALAGLSEDGATLRVLISNIGQKSRALRLQLKNLPWRGPAKYQKQVIDDRYDLQMVGASRVLGSNESVLEDIGGSSVCLLTIQPAAQ